MPILYIESLLFTVFLELRCFLYPQILYDLTVCRMMPTVSTSKTIQGLASEKGKSNTSYLIFSVQNNRLHENKDQNMKYRTNMKCLKCRLLYYFPNAEFF